MRRKLESKKMNFLILIQVEKNERPQGEEEVEEFNCTPSVLGFRCKKVHIILTL